MTLRVLAVLLAVGAVLAAAACGDSSDTAAPTSGTSPAPTSAAPAPSTPTEDPAADPGHLFTADPELLGAHPIRFTSWTEVAPERIAVHFETGVPECYGVDASVTETDSTVTIELRGGTRADAADKMCVLTAIFGTLEVALETPLGERTVLSAA